MFHLKGGDGNGEEGGMTHGEKVGVNVAFRWGHQRNAYSAPLTSGNQF